MSITSPTFGLTENEYLSLIYGLSAKSILQVNVNTRFSLSGLMAAGLKKNPQKARVTSPTPAREAKRHKAGSPPPPGVRSCSGLQPLALPGGCCILHPAEEPTMGLGSLVSGLIRSRHLWPCLWGPPRGQLENPGAP